jgi:hypothetical protein
MPMPMASGSVGSARSSGARSGEDAQRLVAAQLDDPSPAGLDLLLHDLGEAGGQPRSGLVTVCLREARIAADIGDQERADLGRSICAVGHDRRVYVALIRLALLVHARG